MGEAVAAPGKDGGPAWRATHRDPRPSAYLCPMRLTHLGHSCLLVESAESRVLIDPGSFSSGFEQLRDLDAVVVTHQHADHYDAERLPALLAANRQAAVYADPDTAALITSAAASVDVVVLAEGEQHRVGNATLSPVGQTHAHIHDWVPRPTNVGVVLRAEGEPSIYHPGDALDGEPGDVDVLAVPVSAPWCRVADTIGFVRRVAPSGLLPIHDALLSPLGRGLYLSHIGTYGGESLQVHDPDPRVTVEVLL